MPEDASTRRILTLMAHPDDAEILCGGTLALLADRGWKVHITSGAPGDGGTPDLPPDEIAAIRREEGSAAAARIDGTFSCLELRDLRIFYDETSVRRANSLLRRVRPHVVITHSPADYMLDHEEISRVARAACFNAGVPNAPVESGFGDPPLDWIPALYYADPVEGLDPMGEVVRPAFGFDVSGVVERKLEMLACHESQREWLRKHHGMDEYIDTARAFCRARGELFGVEYAEGFRQHLGHAYPRENALAEALGDRLLQPR